MSQPEPVAGNKKLILWTPFWQRNTLEHLLHRFKNLLYLWVISTPTSVQKRGPGLKILKWTFNGLPSSNLRSLYICSFVVSTRQHQPPCNKKLRRIQHETEQQIKQMHVTVVSTAHVYWGNNVCVERGGKNLKTWNVLQGKWGMWTCVEAESAMNQTKTLGVCRKVVG